MPADENILSVRASLIVTAQQLADRMSPEDLMSSCASIDGAKFRHERRTPDLVADEHMILTEVMVVGDKHYEEDRKSGRTRRALQILSCVLFSSSFPLQDEFHVRSITDDQQCNRS